FNRVHNGNGNQSSVTETNDKQELDTSISKKIRVQWSLTSPIKHTLVRNIWVALLSLLFLSTLFNIITLRYYDLFKIDKINDENVGTLTIDIIHLLKKCEKDFDYRKENLSFAPFALSLVIIFSWSIKREKQYSNICYGRRGLLTPIKPFHTENRFTTAAVFGIIFYAIVKIFEELFFGSYELLNRGVLIELIIRLVTSSIVGTIVTTFVFRFQLIIGINNHKRRHRLQMNKNIYLEVPPLENFQLDSLVSKSLHYSVKYFICLFKYCFIGIASCIIRLVLATFLNVVYMARLDYSFLGRPLENLAFCNLLLDETYRKPGNDDNEEFIIPRHDSHVKSNFKEQTDPVRSTNYINHNTYKFNLSTMSNTSLHSKSKHLLPLSISEKSLTKVKYYSTDDLSCIPITEITQKSNLKTTSIVSDNSQATDSMATEKNKQAIETQKKKLQQKFIKKKISNKSNQDISKSIRSSEDNDRESIDQTSKDIPFNNTYLNTNQSLKHQQETTSISHDPIDQRIPKVLNIIPNTQIKKITTKHHDRSILTEEQCPALRETTINSLTSIPRRSRKNNFYFLLLISSDNLSVGISEQSKDLFLLGDQNNTNENNHHDIVISTNKTQTGILNRPHSLFESMPLLSNHSIRPISEQIPTKQNNIENITAVNKEENKKIDRRKIARNRWYLAYTIICKHYLFDLRKNLKEKCNRLYSQQNKSMNETLFRTTSINREIDAASNVLFNTSNMQRRKNKIQESYEPQLSTHHPNLSSMSSDDEHLASPAEEYVAFFLQQSYIYDITEHQTSLQSAHTVQQESSELPSLQSISTTNQLMTDNPPKTSKLMNFDQHMQAWYENEIRKFQNKQPRCYIYTSKYNYHKSKENFSADKEKR
ncbi:unnamed protein product, partial [Rotaria sp. Silwood1]